MPDIIKFLAGPGFIITADPENKTITFTNTDSGNWQVKIDAAVGAEAMLRAQADAAEAAARAAAAENYQLYANLVTAWQGTPDDGHYPSEKLVKDEADAIRAIAVTGLKYRGTLDYGADTVASMNAIPEPGDGASCGVSETNLTYVYDADTEEWDARAHGADAVGDLWRMASWYGEWRGQTFTGNATADIVCRDASDPDDPVWDLLVSESTPLDGMTIGSIDGKTGILDGGVTDVKLAGSYVGAVTVNGEEI
jgi:hypothetical protein